MLVRVERGGRMERDALLARWSISSTSGATWSSSAGPSACAATWWRSTPRDEGDRVPGG